MEFEIAKIILAKEAKPPKIQVVVRFSEIDKPNFSQSGSVTVYLDYSPSTKIKDIEASALFEAQKLLSNAINVITE